jgi:hypothetical protein
MRYDAWSKHVKMTDPDAVVKSASRQVSKVWSDEARAAALAARRAGFKQPMGQGDARVGSQARQQTLLHPGGRQRTITSDGKMTEHDAPRGADPSTGGKKTPEGLTAETRLAGYAREQDRQEATFYPRDIKRSEKTFSPVGKKKTRPVEPEKYGSSLDYAPVPGSSSFAARG